MQPSSPRFANFGSKSLQFALLIGALLIIIGFVAHYPGSIPGNWHRVDGVVSSVTGKIPTNVTLYYPVVQYPALGYSYEVTSSEGYTLPPQVGSILLVAFNPEQPKEARLVNDASPNYFKLLPVAGAAIILFGVYAFARNSRRTRAVPVTQNEAVAVSEPAPEPEQELVEPISSDEQVVVQPETITPTEESLVQPEAIEPEPAASDSLPDAVEAPVSDQEVAAETTLLPERVAPKVTTHELPYGYREVTKRKPVSGRLILKPLKLKITRKTVKAKPATPKKKPTPPKK